MNQVRKVLSGSTALLAARVVVLLVGVLRVAIIARVLGVAEFGTYTFANSFILLLLILAELGLPAVLVREGARDATRIPMLLKGSLLFRGAVTALVLAGCAVGFRLAGADRVTGYCVLLLGAGIGFAGLGNIFQSAVRAVQKMEAIAAVQAVREIVTLGLVWAAFAAGSGLIGLCFAFLVSGVLGLLGNMLLYRVYVGPIPINEKPSSVLFLAREGIPAAVALMVDEFLINLNVSILMAARGREEVAYFGAALRFLFVLKYLPSAYQEALYPVLSRLHTRSRDALRATLRRSIEVLIAGGLLFGLLGAMFSKQAVAIVYGPGFEPAARALSIVSPAIVFIFVCSLAYPFMVSIDRQRMGMAASLAGLGAGLAAAFPLSRAYGYAGSAVAVGVGEGVLGIAALVIIRRMGFAPGLGVFAAKALGAAAVFVLAAYGLGAADAHWILRASLCTLAYLGALVAFRGFRVADARSLLGAASGRVEDP